MGGCVVFSILQSALVKRLRPIIRVCIGPLAGLVLRWGFQSPNHLRFRVPAS